MAGAGEGDAFLAGHDLADLNLAAQVDEAALWRSPGLLGRRPRVQVIRPRDHLVLQVTASQCTVLVGDDRVPRLVPADGATRARLVVGLPPQHVLEQVFQEMQGSPPPPADPLPGAGTPEHPALPVGARFSGPSRLAFVLAAGDAVELTVDGVLAAMGRLPLAVVPLAEPRFVWRAWQLVAQAPGLSALEAQVSTQALSGAGAVIDRVRATRLLTAAGLGHAARLLDPSARVAVVQAAPEDRLQVIGTLAAGLLDTGLYRPVFLRPGPRAPQLDETAVEVPSRLQLSPGPDGAWAHARTVDPTPGATVELWNTRLGVRAGSAEHPSVDESSTEQRVVRGVWTRDLERGDGTLPPDFAPFRSSLRPQDRRDIVRLSTGAAGTSWRLPPPAPVDVNALALTSLGAFVDVRGAWDVPGVAFTEWQHRTTLGRDQFVRVVEKGYLFPFGHRAVLVTETRRRADPRMPEGSFAILWQRHYIVLREQVRAYPGRDMPFVQVTIEPKTTPDINDPASEKVVWPTIGKQQFAFKVTGVDQDGGSHRYATPLLWVREREDGRPTAGEVLAAYALREDASGLHHVEQGIDALVQHDLGGQRVAVAAKGPAGEATYETRALRFAAHPEAATCRPFLLFGDLVIPAVAATTGRKEPLRLTYAPPYLQHGFDASGNHGEVVLTTAEGVAAGELRFDSSDRSGGFLNPSQHIAGIARGSGPVSDVGAAAAGTPADPAALFAGLGKILGLFELSDILPHLDPGDIPSYAARLLDVAGSITGGLQRVVDLLGSASAAAAQLKAAAADLDALIHQTAPAPQAADFAALIATRLGPAVSAGLAPANLASLGKAEAAIVQRALDTVDTVIHPPPGSPIDPSELLAALAAGRPVASVLSHVHLEWRPPITQWPGGSKDDAIFLPSSPQSLLLAVDVRGGDLVPKPSAEVLAQLTDFTLQLVPGMPLVHIPFKRLYFRASTGSKTEIDVDLDQLEWLGVLGFVDKLRQLIPTDGFSDPPSVAVDTQGIQAGFSLGLPNVAVGVFNLSNLSMAADIKLPFIGESPTVGFAFCSRERPFTLAVLFLGGGGFFGLRLSPKKLVLLEAAVEFGATLALDFGVASGSVSCMAGVYLRMEADDGSLTGYLRIRGEVDVLGLISASIEMYMSLTYEFGSGKVVGRATITVEIEVLLFSASVSISAERRFAGSKGDPTFADAMGPYVEPDCPWIDYCQAFAEV